MKPEVATATPVTAPNWSYWVEPFQPSIVRDWSTPAHDSTHGSLDKAGYDAARQQMENDLQAADAEVARLRAELSQAAAELPEFDDVLAELHDWHEVIGASQLATRRRIIGSLIRRVEPVRVRRGRYEAGIDWTPLGKALWQISQRTKTAPSPPRERQPSAGSIRPA